MSAYVNAALTAPLAGKAATWRGKIFVGIDGGAVTLVGEGPANSAWLSAGLEPEDAEALAAVLNVYAAQARRKAAP